MPSITLRVNGSRHTIDVDPNMPLLWAIRDHVGLTGTKFGCGAGLCGACTLHVNGEPVRSCSLPVSAAAGKNITTVEGLSAPGAAQALHPVQEAWLAEQVPQCGYCQSGQIMAAVSLLKKTPNPTDAQIDSAMSNICRCGTYPRIRAAVHRAARRAATATASKTDRRDEP